MIEKRRRIALNSTSYMASQKIEQRGNHVSHQIKSAATDVASPRINQWVQVLASNQITSPGIKSNSTVKSPLGIKQRGRIASNQIEQCATTSKGIKPNSTRPHQTTASNPTVRYRSTSHQNLINPAAQLPQRVERHDRIAVAMHKPEQHHQGIQSSSVAAHITSHRIASHRKMRPHRSIKWKRITSKKTEHCATTSTRIKVEHNATTSYQIERRNATASTQHTKEQRR